MGLAGIKPKKRLGRRREAEQGRSRGWGRGAKIKFDSNSPWFSTNQEKSEQTDRKAKTGRKSDLKITKFTLSISLLAKLRLATILSFSSCLES